MTTWCAWPLCYVALYPGEVYCSNAHKGKCMRLLRHPVPRYRVVPARWWSLTDQLVG
jgi:hypothetical protein